MNSTLSAFLLLSVSALPLLLAMALMLPSLRRFALPFAPWAALPALLVSVLMPLGISVDVPWLLLGSHLGFDETARVFLFFTSLLWLVAGIYSVGYFSECSAKARFLTWFLLAMAGNLGLILAQDMILFYTFFTLMSFSSYALVVFDRTADAFRAGRIYIILVVVGEVMLFAAFVLAAMAADGIGFLAVQAAMSGAEFQHWIIGLVLLGFGIKAGVVGLHVWLPLAHPVAPVPASAVLSGAMISAGLLGWLRVLPLGETALPGWGGVMVVAGLVAVFYAVLVGLLQNNAKTVLAYSSISTMGIMTAAVGVGLIAPHNWPFILSAVLIYALQHGLAKGALFLGVGMVVTPPVSKLQRYLLIMGLLLLALSLAGAPLTSGMIAKHLLNIQLASVTSPWGDWLQMMMPWSAVASSMIMARFLFLLWPQCKVNLEAVPKPGMMWLSWIVLIVVVVSSPWVISLVDINAGSIINIWSMKIMFGAIWPVALGGSLVIIALLIIRYRRIHYRFSVPPGDILIIVEKWLWPLLVLVLSTGLSIFEKIYSSVLTSVNGWCRYSTWKSVLDIGENRLARWSIGTLWFLILTMIFVLLASQIIV